MMIATSSLAMGASFTGVTVTLAINTLLVCPFNVATILTAKGPVKLLAGVMVLFAIA